MKNSFIYSSFFIKVLWRSRKAVTLLWLTPILFLFGVGIVVSQLVSDEERIQSFQIAIINEDPTVETNLVIKQLIDSEHLSKMMKSIEVNRSTADRMLQDNEVAAVIHIPKGFSSDVAKGKNTPVKVIGNNHRPLQATLVRHVMESAANFTSAAQSGINTVNYYMKEMDFEQEERKKEIKKEIFLFSLHVLGRGAIFEEMLMSNIFQTSLTTYYGLSFYILLMMMWSFFGLLLLKGKINQSIHQRLKGLGYTTVHHTVASMLTTFLFVACGSTIVAFFLFFFLKIDSLVTILQIIMVSAVYMMVFISFFHLLQVIIPSVKLYMFVGTIIILFATTAGGHIVPRYYFPESFQVIGHFTVNSWFISILFSIFQGEVNATTYIKMISFFVLSILFLFITLLISRTERKGAC